MIVRDGGDHWLLITQPDHAHLARRVMEHWPALASSPRRDDILLAIGEHDCAWKDVDAAPQLDASSGEIVDFVHAPLAVRQGGAPGAIATLTASPWAAALVAQHGLTVYDRFRADPAWVEFFATLEAIRRDRLAASDLTLDALVEDYPFLRLGDLISLQFCTGWEDAERFSRWSVSAAGTRVHVEPADQGVRLPMEIEAARVAKVRYTSHAHLHAALKDAERVTLRGELVA